MLNKLQFMLSFWIAKLLYQTANAVLKQASS